MKKVLLLLVLLGSINLFPSNWTQCTIGTTDIIWGIDIVSPSVAWVCTKDGHVYKSVDGFTTWTAAGTTGQGAYSIAAVDANTAVVVTGPDAGNTGKIYRTTNGGTSWSIVYSPSAAWFNFVDNIDATNFWAQSDPMDGSYLIVKSTDAGATWTLCSNRPAAGGGAGANGSYYRIGNTCWFGASTTNKIFKSTNGPDGPWTSASATVNNVGTLAFSSGDGAGLCGFWNPENANLNKSTNGGGSWTASPMNFSNFCTGLDFVQTTSYAWATVSDNLATSAAGAIWFTTNNGATWTNDLVTNSGMNVVKIFGDINVALAGGNNGLLYKSNRTAVIVPVELTSFTAAANNGSVTLNWSTATETNNKGFEIQRKSANSDFVTVGYVNGNGSSTSTHNYSFTEAAQPGTYTYRLRQVDFNGRSEFSNAVEVLVNPSSYTMSQNYPNPFNPSTKIDFTVAKSGMVKLAVYNLLGQQVETLVNEVKEAGTYNVSFNASNLTSGVYFYKLETPEFSKTMKMILNK